MKLLRPLPCLVAGLGLSSVASAQTTLFSQNFDGLGAQVITNSTGTTSTQVSNVTGTLGSGTAAVSYRLGSQQTFSVVDKGSGNFAARLSDNNSVVNDSTLHANFSGVSTTGTGNNIISGSFDYTALALSSGTRGNFVFGLGTSGSIASSGTTTAVQLIFNNGQSVSYVNGGTTVAVPSLTLATGTAYRFAITANFGSDTQDTWALTITNLSTSTEVSSITGISTRAANITPGAVFFSAATFDSRLSPDPQLELDNINFVSTSAIPEPGTYALLFGTASLMAVALRRRRR